MAKAWAVPGTVRRQVWPECGWQVANKGWRVDTEGRAGLASQRGKFSCSLKCKGESPKGFKNGVM